MSPRAAQHLSHTHFTRATHRPSCRQIDEVGTGENQYEGRQEEGDIDGTDIPGAASLHQIVGEQVYITDRPQIGIRFGAESPQSISEVSFDETGQLLFQFPGEIPSRKRR